MRNYTPDRGEDLIVSLRNMYRQAKQHQEAVTARIGEVTAIVQPNRKVELQQGGRSKHLIFED